MLCVFLWVVACGEGGSNKSGGSEGGEPLPGPGSLPPGEVGAPSSPSSPLEEEVPLLELEGNIEIAPASAYIDTELTATYDGGEAVHFQWKKEGEDIEGATGNTYSPSSAGGYAVTVGAPGYVSKTSPPVTVSVDPSLGLTWTAFSNAFTKQYINGLCHGNGHFVAGTYEGTIASSTDSMTWTQSVSKPFGTSTSGNSAVIAIAYGNGRFVAGGMQGKMAYSDDNGKTWVAVQDSTFGEFFIENIAWGGGRFVAVGPGGKIAHSTDGKSWVAVKDSTFDSKSIIYGIAYGGGRFIVGGMDGYMAWSADGDTWTAIPRDGAVFGKTHVLRIAYGGGRFIAANYSNRMAWSTDGETWTVIAKNPFKNVYGLAYGGGKFVAGGTAGRMAHSEDGETWTLVSNSTFGAEGTISRIVYGNGRFIAVGRAGGVADGYGQMAYSTGK